jgi:DNA-binding GntR family transcriptional regulator
MAAVSDDSRPPSKKIADDITLGVVSGVISPGDRLPSTADLMAEYEVANQTVQNAMRLLKDSGLVYTVKGQGAFVRNEVNPKDYEGMVAEQGSPMFQQILARLNVIGDEISTINRRLAALEAQGEDEESP